VGRNKQAIFQDYLKIAQGMHEMQVPFCMGVGGGSFDIIAGRTKRAPVWMQKSGLEWCYRIYQEPGRMWKRYAKTNPVFVIRRLPRYHLPELPQLNIKTKGI